MTGSMKIILGAAGVGLMGGVIAERMTSPDAISRSRDADRWNALHQDFLREHPVPDGTHLLVNSDPAWKNAALVGGGAALLGGAGAGVALLASKMKPQNFPLFVAGVAAAALGGAAAVGAGASWGVR